MSGASLVAQLVKNPTAMQETLVWFLSPEIPLDKAQVPTLVFLGFSGGSKGKQSTCNSGDLGLIPGLGRSPGGRHGNPLQCCCLENPHGQRSLVGYSLWGHKELYMAEWLSTAQRIHITVCLRLSPYLHFYLCWRGWWKVQFKIPQKRGAFTWF